MEEIFATKIVINDVLDISDFEIPLSETERKHLIITGKNGSGKTTVLNELKKFLNLISTQSNLIYNSLYTYIKKAELERIKQSKIYNFTNSNIDNSQLDSTIHDLELLLNQDRKNGFLDISTEIFFNNLPALHTDFVNGDLLIAFFSAKRSQELIKPSGIAKIKMKNAYEIEDKARIDFIQYLVNLKANQSFSKDDGKLEIARSINDWFNDFEQILSSIFNEANLKLEFDYINYNFNIIIPGKLPFSLNQLSDGYASIIDIVAELIMRMEEHKTKNYDVQGIVLIDEIETHLHIELQKKILPFLTAFFPKIQFIVTTHSPFVISSIENAVICDLEKRIITNDLSGYSYEAIVETYFDSDKYSSLLKQRVEEYEKLMDKAALNELETIRLQELKSYFNHIPMLYSDELIVKLQQIKLKNIRKKTA